MRKIITTLYLLCCLLISDYSFAQQDFVQWQPNAQSIAIGGSSVALAYDPAACYWNPASIAFLSTNRVLLNIDNESFLNYVGLTKFFPPSAALGVAIFRSNSGDQQYDLATIAMGYKLIPFLSMGMNLNYSKTMHNKIYTSAGFGLFFKSLPDYQASYSYNSLWSWLRSKQMSEKFSFGISLHNISLNENKKNHELRIAAAIKPHHSGPLVHFAYHAIPNDYSLHVGAISSLSKHLDLLVGVRDLNINNFTAGTGIKFAPLEIDMCYDFKSTKIDFSLILRLGEEKDVLFRKYKEIGDQHIKENNFSQALNAYQKALAYDPANGDVSYLISILNKESNETSQTVDSLLSNGDSFEKKGWFINAFITYQKILTIDQYNKKARSRLKELNSEITSYLDKIFLQGVSYYKGQDLKSAKIIFDNIILVNKEHPGAKTYLAKIDSIISNHANEHFYRGLGYFNQKNLQRAEQEFKDALLIDPEHQQAKEYLDRTEREIKNNNRLIDQYLGEAKKYEQEQKYLSASLSYRKILEIDRNHQYARSRLAYLDNYIKNEVDEKFKRAKLLYERMNYSGAITILREILSIDPDHSPSKNYLRRANQKLLNLAEQHYLRAQSFYNQKNWDVVLQECNLTLAMNPDHLAAKELQQMALSNISIDKLIERGANYYERGDLLNARSVFRQVLNKEANNLSATNYLNRIDTDLKNRVEELFNMGMVKYAEGNYEEAILEWEKILVIDSEHKSAKEYIQKAQERIEALKRIE